jgi:segregation and condensation protein A
METQEEDKFITKTALFEGPLDLLLSLIEERKLFINEISLSSITEEYARYINDLQSKETGGKYYEITGYLVVLATLLLIKSRSLLPNFEITIEEKGTIEDLEDRLKVYKIYKDLSKEIADRFGKRPLYTRAPQKRSVVFIPDSQINVQNLHSLIVDSLTRVPVVEARVAAPEVRVRATITIEEVMDRIHKKVEALTSFTFSDVAGVRKTYTKEEKVFTVISFLAILELVRTGLLVADQEDTFGEMNITRTNQEGSYEHAQ